MPRFLSRFKSSSLFNRASAAGPHRLLAIGAVFLLLLYGVISTARGGRSVVLPSNAGGKIAVNPLPGGYNSNPEQEKLALMHEQAMAEAASRRGQSYTPPLAGSHTFASMPSGGQSSPINADHRTTKPNPPRPKATQSFGTSRPDPAVRTVSQTQSDAAEEKLYSDAVDRLLKGWDGKAPQTVVTIDPVPVSHGEGVATRPVMTDRPAARASDAVGTLLVPAGRGVFAHTILSVDSDSGGPVVLQADSGPLANDRMIGNFSKAGANGGASADRLVVRVNSLEHHGHTIAVDGIVTAPDTMETSVASSVDEHYLARFVLPAAAAFVQGLGQALATTSNTTGVLSPLGGSSYVTQLNLPQQLGVGAGTAAAQIGNTLNQQAPRSPTIHLDSNADVGVMFLTTVRDNPAQ